jgi:DNA-binding beta-propeller fold protein YncE
MPRRSRGVPAPSAVGLCLALAAGCGKNGGTAPDAGLGSGNLTSATAVANGPTFALPLDAAPGPDGTEIYFTGLQPGPNLGSPGIFKVAAAGGIPTALAVGGDIGAPLGIAVSSDGSTLYVADPAFATASDKGAIFTVSTAGGMPSALAETSDYVPRSLAVSKVGGSDNLYFIGEDKTDGATGIFKDASNAVTPVITGNAAGDPQAVAAWTDGTLYFVDAGGTVQKIAAGGSTATPLGGAAHDLAISFPAGIEVSQDGRFVLVPVTDPITRTQSIARIDVASGDVAQYALGLFGNSEAGGIHRAASKDVYAFVDTGAGSTGTVYLLK